MKRLFCTPTAPALRNRTCILLIGLLTWGIVGCDEVDDTDLLRFRGTWRITQVQADGNDLTNVALTRFEEAFLTFVVGDQDEFIYVGDLEGTANDILFDGTFDADSRDLTLRFDDPARAFDFSHDFLDANRVVLITDDAPELLLEIFFELRLNDRDELILVLERADT